ncbi:MAG: GTPase, partial [Planctomycetota bacterium]
HAHHHAGGQPTVCSYTRQPTAELHTVGCPPLLERILANLQTGGARLARPGEFTLRAVLGGRIDLAKAEAVLGAIDARDEREFEVALRQMAGGLSTKIHALRDELLDLSADLEAGLDFVDEDIQFVSFAELTERLTRVNASLQSLLDQMGQRRLTTHRPRVVICGAPNVGKSTLFNAMGDDRQALTANEPGTTRDYLLKTTEVGGQPVELVDTAGLAVSAVSEIDALAQQQTRDLIQQAQLILLCIDRSRPLQTYDQQLLTETASQTRLLVLTKADLPVGCEIADRPGAIALSVLEPTGLTSLRLQIARVLGEGRPRDVVSSTAVRAAESLQLTHDCLRRAAALAAAEESEELIAAELRVALDALGLVVGVVVTDDLLDRIFSRFCIGK